MPSLKKDVMNLLDYIGGEKDFSRKSMLEVCKDLRKVFSPPMNQGKCSAFEKHKRRTYSTVIIVAYLLLPHSYRTNDQLALLPYK